MSKRAPKQETELRVSHAAELIAESHKQTRTSDDKSYVITKRCLKTIGMTEKIKWSQADLNR